MTEYAVFTDSRVSGLPEDLVITACQKHCTQAVDTAITKQDLVAKANAVPAANVSCCLEMLAINPVTLKV